MLSFVISPFKLVLSYSLPHFGSCLDMKTQIFDIIEKAVTALSYNNKQTYNTKRKNINIKLKFTYLLQDGYLLIMELVKPTTLNLT